MARHLQEKYREYGRRKQQPFRFLVDRGKNTLQLKIKLNRIGKLIIPINMNVNWYFCKFTAYKTVLHSYGLDSNPSTEEEENSDLELMEVNFNLKFI